MILKNDWLTRATIRFLRIALWFPFLVVFAALPETFALGPAAAMLAAIYHYLTARSFLEFSNRAACHYAAGEITLQCLFFNLIAQVWMRGWKWAIFPVKSDATMGFTAFALILTLVLLVNWIFKRNFPETCTMRAIQQNKESLLSKGSVFLGVALLTLIWLLFWQLICVTLLNESAGSFPAIQRAFELLIHHEVSHDIIISLTEVGGRLFFGGLLALTLAMIMRQSETSQRLLTNILPATFLSPIVLWNLVLYFVILFRIDVNWNRSFVSGIEYKIMGVGFLTFFPWIQNLWAFRDTPLLTRCLFAIDDALPIAFVAMCFAELYAATAGLGFQMVIASATYQYRQGLGAFLVTAILLAGISWILRLFVKWLQPESVIA